ncbi:MAG: integral rane protein, partial [Actinomycetia bacterium]|nr:integral rane protein [Actinomycetes bacterium]
MSDFLRPSRLDQPRSHRKRLPIIDADAFGKLSERVARFLGTGRFLAFQTVLVTIWIGINLYAGAHSFDPYPFILLNLAFSTQAAYAAPLILLA